MDKELDNLNHIADGRILATKDELQALITKEKNKAKHEQRHQPLGVSRWIAVGEEHGYWQHPMTEKQMLKLVDSIKRRIDE
jgi:hypothetical protein